MKDIGIGSRLRSARQRGGLTREALASRAGVSRAAIAQIESGRRQQLRPGTLFAVAKALGVTIDYLIGGLPVNATVLDHRALFYDSDESFLASAAPCMADAIDRAEAVLAVTSKANIALLKNALGAQQRHAEFVEQRDWGRDPRSALGAYRAFVSARLRAGAPWALVLAEQSWAESPTSPARLCAIYECVLELALRASPVTIVCPYDTRSVDSETAAQARATHPHLADGNRARTNPAHTDPVETILQV